MPKRLMRSIRSIRKRIDLVAAAAVIALLAILLGRIGCSGALAPPIAAAHGDDSAPMRGGTLRLATLGEPRGFDPATGSDGVSSIIINLMFDGLVDYDEKSRIVPVLAERWEVANGGKTYRFFLREGVRFHDGEELTADDVKRTVERALHPSTPNAWASQFASIVGFEQYTQKKAPHLDGVVVEGRYVVTFELSHPDSVLLPSLAFYPLRPVCRSAGDRYSPSWHPCGAGPFRLPPDGWRRGERVDVVRHDGYFRSGRPYLDGVRLTVATLSLTQRFKFEQGEIDFYRDMSGPDLARFQGDRRWAPFGDEEPDRIITGEAMNVEMPPFDNIEVRRAVAAAIDREHYRLMKPAALTPANQPIPPDVPGHDAMLVGQRYDYAAALEHMRLAGYAYDPKTGQGGYPNEIEYVAYEEGLPRYTAQVLQQELAKIGLRLRIKLVSFGAWLSITHKRKGATFAAASFAMDFPDPNDFLESLFASESINDENSSNVSFYRNASLDDLLKRARSEVDDDTRARGYREASQIVCDDAPWAFTHYYHYYSARQPYLRGYKPHPVAVMYMANAWLDRANAAVAARSAPLFRDALGSIFGARAAAKL
jgi:ABC-type transport system substrate-binding protein